MIEGERGLTGPETTIDGDGTLHLKPRDPPHLIDGADRQTEESPTLLLQRTETEERGMIGETGMTVGETKATGVEMTDGQNEGRHKTIGGPRGSPRRIERLNGRGSWLLCSKMLLA
jgi:hypothetical protein